MALIYSYILEVEFFSQKEYTVTILVCSAKVSWGLHQFIPSSSVFERNCFLQIQGNCLSDQGAGMQLNNSVLGRHVQSLGLVPPKVSAIYQMSKINCLINIIYGKTKRKQVLTNIDKDVNCYNPQDNLALHIKITIIYTF